ncbi:hypothetical protein U9M48_005593 [Paspalum notatum var. saurae]|uniref:Uncharacterized protein n=1 Tax=Paspalum notatum var. saurae TaxID=547442 RepID=A0AAQ3PSJ9_PASNO
MTGCNSCIIPMDPRLQLTKETAGAPVDPTRYRSIIGSLRYLVNTRPDIAFAVGMVSRFMEAPREEHWQAVKQILRYLAGTVGYGCVYGAGTGRLQSLVGFTDSDHAGDKNDRKSTTGTVFFLGGNLITWASQKQRVVALSSCEAEYIAAAAGACQGVWLSRLLAELVGDGTAEKFKLFVDNQSAIELSKNPVHHDRSKHIDTRFHYVRECIEEDRMEIEHVGTKGQLADILTKALCKVKFIELRQRLGMAQNES